MDFKALAEAIGPWGALAVLGLIGVWWFVTQRVWPYLTTVHWPEKRQAERTESEAVKKISETLELLRVDHRNYADVTLRRFDTLETKIDRVAALANYIHSDLAILLDRLRIESPSRLERLPKDEHNAE